MKQAKDSADTPVVIMSAAMTTAAVHPESSEFAHRWTLHAGSHHLEHPNKWGAGIIDHHAEFLAGRCQSPPDLSFLPIGCQDETCQCRRRPLTVICRRCAGRSGWRSLLHCFAGVFRSTVRLSESRTASWRTGHCPQGLRSCGRGEGAVRLACALQTFFLAFALTFEVAFDGGGGLACGGAHLGVGVHR